MATFNMTGGGAYIDWVDMTAANGFTVDSNISINNMKIAKIGNCVLFKGTIKTVNTTTSLAMTPLFTLPSKYRPANDTAAIQCSGSSYFALWIINGVLTYEANQTMYPTKVQTLSGVYSLT